MTEREELRNIVAAWEALPAGYYSRRQVERWMKEFMKPAIDRARKALADGVREDK